MISPLMFGGQSRDLRILKLLVQRLPAMRSTQFFTSPSRLFSHGHPSSPVFLWLVPSKDGSPPKNRGPFELSVGWNVSSGKSTWCPKEGLHKPSFFKKRRSGKRNSSKHKAFPCFSDVFLGIDSPLHSFQTTFFSRPDPGFFMVF